ncbi:MAG TPA: fimbria/pilus periplasmic chaperone [Bacteroidales bacterium]
MNNTTKRKLTQSAQLFTLLIVFGLTILLSVFSNPVLAQGDLMIFPRRVVFEGKDKSQDLHLTNTGKDSANYVISIVEIKMKDDGSFETITEAEPGQNFAAPYLRFFPRSVTLAPGETQVIKIQLTKTSQLKEGEYRSHLYFRAVPDQKPLGEVEANVDTTNIGVILTPIFGITIPAIIRVGQSTATVNFSDLSVSMLNDTTPVLNLTFNRSGNMSVYGDVSVTYISPQGKETEVGIVKGIAVYTPGTVRRAQLPLDDNQGIDYKTGKIKVVYTSLVNGKNIKMAEAELNLN